jgi:cytochrome P450
MSDRPTSDWDPRDGTILRDQRAAYDALRERCPVAHSDFLGWTLSRHQDVVDVLADPQTYSSASHHRAVPNGIDPPEHTRYRRPLERYFEFA